MTKGIIKGLIEEKRQESIPEPPKTVVTNRIKVLRAERGWTQADLARRVGISRQAVISIEKYKYTPSLELAFNLAKVFKVDITEVFKLEEREEI